MIFIGDSLVTPFEWDVQYFILSEIIVRDYVKEDNLLRNELFELTIGCLRIDQ